MQIPRPAGDLIQIETRAPVMGSNGGVDNAPGERRMAWHDLFTTDYGLMSLAVMVGMLAIGAYFGHKFNELSKQKPGEQKDW
jgi:hypothetical protein